MTPVLSLEAWRALTFNEAEPQVDRKHAGVSHEPCLERLIDTQLSRWGRAWSKLNSSEGLRRRCICERLCRDAQNKYAEVVKEESRSWDVYLSRPQGRRRISEW